jgi:hypothetical protein
MPFAMSFKISCIALGDTTQAVVCLDSSFSLVGFALRAPSSASGKMSYWPHWHFSTNLVLPRSVPWKSGKASFVFVVVFMGPRATWFLYFSSCMALWVVYIQDIYICSLTY